MHNKHTVCRKVCMCVYMYGAQGLDGIMRILMLHLFSITSYCSALTLVPVGQCGAVGSGIGSKDQKVVPVGFEFGQSSLVQ